MPLLQYPADLDDTKYDLASEDDLNQIWSWNGAVSPAVDACVHDLIRQRLHPDAKAVSSWDGDFTYGDLDSLSSRLAIELTHLGVGPETIVPLFFEKSKWMPVAMLSVMKSGGASCGIDTTQPEARLLSIMEQIQPRVVVCSAGQEGLVKKVSKDIGIIILDYHYIERLPIGPTDLTSVPFTKVCPANALYLVFTSGSTGKPKGVIITHSNFSSALIHQNSQLGFQRTSRVLDFASYAFDAAWYNTLHTFYAGGCLCIPSEEDRRNDLAGSISRLRPNFANLTPKLCEFLDTQSLHSLEMLELAGEAPDERQVNRMRKLTKVRFAYGPAECSILSTVTDEFALPSKIGKGLGIQTWIVSPDDEKSLVSIGSVGELWIEGPLVGRGYLNEPEKTKRAFVDSPEWLLKGTSKSPGRRGRLYRTGDLVRYDADGVLLFVGRKDGQVKIRGQRVELGEIEHHARQILDKGEYQVVVETVKPLKSDNVILVLFIKAADNIEDLVTSLNRKLADVLPAYMIPTFYVSIDQIPLSQTGKTDRQQLRQLGASFTLERLASMNLARQRGRPPETAIERELQRLWSSVLNIDSSIINSDDSFLKLGGDSLAMMRLVATARENGLSFSVGDVFKNPRLSDLATAVREISSKEMRSAFIKPFSLLKEQNEETVKEVAARLCGIEACQVEDVFPCTPLQEGMLALSAWREDQYIVHSLYKLRSFVQVEKLQAAWNIVAQQSPILRTRIVDLGEQGLVQVITKTPIEWSSIPGLTSDFDTAYLPCIMGQGTPLAHFRFLETDFNESYFVLTMHHAICDGWTVPILCRMAEQAYHGRSVPPSPSFQRFVQHVQELYMDYASRKWRRYLHESETPTFLRPPQANYQPRAKSEMRHLINDFLWPRKGVTPSNIIRAAWSILSAQYTASTDIVFGATVSGRQAPVPLIEQMTGPTIATVPVRILLDWDNEVDQFLERVQEHSLEMADVEQMGLQRIRRVSEDAEKACQFQTLLVIQPPENKEQNKMSLFMPINDRIRSLGAFNSYAMLLECVLSDEGALLDLSFDSLLLHEGQAERMMHQLEHILRQLCIDSEGSRKLSTLDLVSWKDLNDIWGLNRYVPAAVEVCIHQHISKTIRQQLKRPAICAWDGNLTYEELDISSTRLAIRLRQLGVRSEVIVPMCLDKSKWTPVAMLAILKAEGAFSLLPPSLPSARREAMISAIRPSVVITSPQYSRYFVNLQTVFPEEHQAESGWQHSQAENLPRTVKPATIAAVLFTSGTTGTPKGIMLDHRCLCTTAKYMGREFKVDINTRVFQYASYSFDVSIHETFMILLAGGCLCIPSEHDRLNDLAGSVTRLQANWASFSPSVVRILSPDCVTSLKTLVFAGEALTERDVLPWLGKAEIFNWYGPAEYSLSATSQVKIPGWNSSSLGYGSASTCWIVRPDNQKALSPFGAIGELVVEGPGLMMGYLQDAQRTAAAVAVNPPWLKRNLFDESGSCRRLYYTGDLVKYDVDGSLTYIGRRDSQVKIRGQRVELEEVEHHVIQKLQTIDVFDAQVVVEIITPIQAASPKLVAFVKMDRPQSQVNELEKKLVGVLPTYMIPSLFICISEIPLTANGKTDRKRLRDIGSSLKSEQIASLQCSPRTQERKLPTTFVEKKLQELWSSILAPAIPPSMDDNFFESGGDSIAAMRLVTAARQHGLSFTVADIFSMPLLSDLAAVAQPSLAKSEVSLIRPLSLLDHAARDFVHSKFNGSFMVSDAYPITDWQAICVSLASVEHPRLVDYFSIDFPKTVSVQEVERSCRELWSHLAILRMIFVPWNSRFLQLIPESLETPIEKHHLTEAKIEEVADRICREDSQKSLVPGLAFTHFYILSASNHAVRLMVRLSHAQYDGTSLIHLMKCLRASLKHETLPETAPFSSFIQHTRDNLSKSVNYWKTILLGSHLTRIAPCQPIFKTREGRVIPIEVERRVKLSRSYDRFTPATTFTTACAHFLAQITASSDVTFGRVVSGRAMLPVHLRDTVGPCMNIIPVRIRNVKCLKEIRQSVHTQIIDSLPYDTLGPKELFELCTDWPRDVCSFGLIASYEDLGDAEEEICGVPCRLQSQEIARPGRKMMHDDTVMVHAKPTGDEFRIVVNADGRVYTEEAVRRWCDMLVEAMLSLQSTRGDKQNID